MRSGSGYFACMVLVAVLSKITEHTAAMRVEDEQFKRNAQREDAEAISVGDVPTFFLLANLAAGEPYSTHIFNVPVEV
ncbi:type VI secretion protein, putative [Babesia ovata]|uniref:Type VI secretion protein, putative n=1 Tax=Babesia ovata TaxID=189622 RepID=A0A2H6KGW7_9APIC|nr:type VI secretion protein, putative [Babesia ovata]GBE62235.1 type VI secretion protein, putative [Babesia ovata]